MIKTVKFRIKDSNKKKLLDTMARDVNFVWNVLNAASRKKWKESRSTFHKFDPWYNNIIKGASYELSINFSAIAGVRDQFHKDLHQHKKQLRFRGRKSKKWIPFKTGGVRVFDGYFVFRKIKFNIWQSMKIKGVIKSGSITMDALGRWFISISYEVDCKGKECGVGKVGIDLGLKTAASCSDGEKLDLSDLKVLDKKIATAQRARNFRRAKALHIKKVNIKKDRFNKFALGLVKKNNLIAIGDVTGFTSGKFAKSRYLNSWSVLKNKIKFKCTEHSARYVEVSEHLTTQTCNTCGSIEGPKGIKELSVRFWVCSCGAGLNRDINAAINILNRAKVLAS